MTTDRLLEYTQLIASVADDLGKSIDEIQAAAKALAHLNRANELIASASGQLRALVEMIRTDVREAVESRAN
jgi:hypothetical protein